ESVAHAIGTNDASATEVLSAALSPRPETTSAGAVAGMPSARGGPSLLKTAKEHGRVVRRNPGASLVDLGDGVLSVEFHWKMNAIGGDTVQMLHAGVKEATANFAALVVGNDALNF